VGVVLHIARCEAYRHAAVQVTIIFEPTLDVLTLVSERDCEFMMTVTIIVHHDVPKDRHGADLDHWLGTYLSFFRQPGPKSAGENTDLHAVFSTNTRDCS